MSKCPVCGVSLDGGKEVQDRFDRTIVVCPKCGMQSPVLSNKQLSGFSLLWSIGVLGLIAGVWVRTLDLFGLEHIISTIAFVVGGISLVPVVAVTIARKMLFKKAKQKWQSEHPTA